MKTELARQAEADLLVLRSKERRLDSWLDALSKSDRRRLKELSEIVFAKGVLSGIDIERNRQRNRGLLMLDSNTPRRVSTKKGG